VAGGGFTAPIWTPGVAASASKWFLAPRPLDSPSRLTMLAAMQATARDFTRQFPRFRKAARAGQTVRVQDRDGVVYVFARDKSDVPSLADVAGHVLGSINSGLRRKSLRGYGKD
jgi:hypothetical protein